MLIMFYLIVVGREEPKENKAKEEKMLHMSRP
jgi:hypothetical protein